MNIYYLSDSWPWLGEHTSYAQLVKYVQKINPDAKASFTRFDLMHRLIGKAYLVSKGQLKRHDSAYAAAEVSFARQIKEGGVYHVLYYDVHYFMWESWQKAPKNLIGTIHHPPGREYPLGMKENLKRMSSAILLCRRDLDFYEDIIGKGRVKFIPHGVDTEFFSPKFTSHLSPFTSHLLFTGQNGRNTKMLQRVILRLLKGYPELKFDLLVPKAKRKVEGLKHLHGHPRVVWHEGISDERLRELYQKSYLLLQPMEDCAANNAIVESLASGLPAVTTDVGGVRDYGGGSIYPVVANNDDEAMIALVKRYLTNESWRNDIGKECRKFAEENLAWPIIAKKHLEVYKELSA